MEVESFLVTAILVLFFAMFLIMFVLFLFSFVRGFRASVYRAPPIRLEELSCPRCGSKELEELYHRVVRCRRCGFMFSIGPFPAYSYRPLWPLFWWFPIIWIWPIWWHELRK